MIASILLFALGSMVRDGFPDFKTMLRGLVGTRWEWVYHLSTHWARISGALLCGLGAGLTHDPEYGVIVGAAILAGFYLDSGHASGQGADNLKSFGYLALSGTTSLIPLALALGFYADRNYFFLPILGLAKDVIWPLAWKSGIDEIDPGKAAIRTAAIIFYALIGVVVGAYYP